MTSVSCYNKGCGQKFNPDENKPDACCFHPGVPVFHDALKGWSCCKKRSTDFTQFLSFPGCTTGPHSNEKPVEPEKPKQECDIPDEQISNAKTTFQQQRLPTESIERPSADEPLTKLKTTVVASLQKALDKHMELLSLEKKTDNNATEEIKVGTSCKNNGCKGTYTSVDSNKEVCNYHPGVAIFHEGMKYWSCCQRKTSDFTNFLDQAGCETGKHLWVKEEITDTRKTCRVDWFQTSPAVNISVFAKLAVPEKTYVEVNQVTCHIYVTFEGGKSVFEQTLALREAIIPDKSEVKLMGTKVEIILKKAEAFSWPSLELPQMTNGEEATDEKES